MPLPLLAQRTYFSTRAVGGGEADQVAPVKKRDIFSHYNLTTFGPGR